MLYINLGDVDLELSPNPATSHLGNGYVRNIGKYSDIWPTLNLITDCKQENNQALARLFLSFANKPFKFTKNDLIKINPKFAAPEFNTATVNYFCKFLTGIAIHYIFFESARRVVLTEAEDRFNAEAPQDIPVASNIIIVLKALRDGYLTKLEDAFSPNSEFILITREAVKKQSKKDIQTAITSMNALGINRVKKEHQKDAMTPNDMVAHGLYPDSEDFNSEETEHYPGQKITLGKIK